MENASKALIIAGAILLAILLISLGIFIFSQAQDTVTNSGMSQAETSAFNTKFTKYEGVRKGSVVRSMIQEVIASNADENNSSAGRTVKIIIKPKQGNAEPLEGDNIKSSKISNSKSYNVEVTGYTKGCVSEITITEQ